MRRRQPGVGAALIIGLAVAAPGPAALAQSDPFQSNPGPAPAPKPAAPRPVVRTPRPVRPEPEPTLPTPAPPAVAVAPAPPDPSKRFEGFWTGRYFCSENTMRHLPAFSRPVTAQVKGNQFILINDIPAGAPGSWQGSGAIGPDGSIAVAIQAVGAGNPGSPYSRGQQFTRQVRGRFNGDQLQAPDIDSGQRSCGLTMSKRP